LIFKIYRKVEKKRKKEREREREREREKKGRKEEGREILIITSRVVIDKPIKFLRIHENTKTFMWILFVWILYRIC